MPGNPCSRAWWVLHEASPDAHLPESLARFLSMHMHSENGTSIVRGSKPATCVLGQTPNGNLLKIVIAVQVCRVTCAAGRQHMSGGRRIRQPDGRGPRAEVWAQGHAAVGRVSSLNNDCVSPFFLVSFAFSACVPLVLSAKALADVCSKWLSVPGMRKQSIEALSGPQDVIPLFMGAFLCATANSLNWMIAGRVIIGIGIGLASGLVPLFISEVRFAPVPASAVARVFLPTRHNMRLQMQSPCMLIQVLIANRCARHACIWSACFLGPKCRI